MHSCAVEHDASITHRSVSLQASRCAAIAQAIRRQLPLGKSRHGVYRWFCKTLLPILAEKRFWQAPIRCARHRRAGFAWHSKGYASWAWIYFPPWLLIVTIRPIALCLGIGLKSPTGAVAHRRLQSRAMSIGPVQKRGLCFFLCIAPNHHFQPTFLPPRRCGEVADEVARYAAPPHRLGRWVIAMTSRSLCHCSV